MSSAADSKRYASYLVREGTCGAGRRSIGCECDPGPEAKLAAGDEGIGVAKVAVAYSSPCPLTEDLQGAGSIAVDIHPAHQPHVALLSCTTFCSYSWIPDMQDKVKLCMNEMLYTKVDRLPMSPGMRWWDLTGYAVGGEGWWWTFAISSCLISVCICTHV